MISSKKEIKTRRKIETDRLLRTMMLMIAVEGRRQYGFICTRVAKIELFSIFKKESCRFEIHVLLLTLLHWKINSPFLTRRFYVVI